MKTLIITAADAKYFELVQGTILSIRENPQGKNINIGFFDLGCTPQQLSWLQQQVDIIKQPAWEFDFPAKDNVPEHLKALLARPFLRQYFPNFDIYLWIDADAWLQDWQAIDLFIKGAAKRGLAIVPEINRSSQLQYGELPQYWQDAYYQYQIISNAEIAEKLCNYPMLNAGVFALHKDAPHWEIWAECLDNALQRTCSMLTDQFALNLAVYNYDLFDYTEMLPAWCNWTCHYGLPAWDKDKSCLVETYLPHTKIGIIHLTKEKFDRVEVITTDMDIVEVSLRYDNNQNNASLPIGDYVSPGLEIIQPDRYFPNMIIGDTNTCPWPHLRRDIPHNWYVDKRYPIVGFLSRDEAHILYNTALKFKGKKALEIGCWLGWSACHLALAGVELDIIDPILYQPEFYESVSNSLTAAGVINSVKLIPGYSPEKVEELAAEYGKKWSLIFIDGNHEEDGPLQDAIACEKYAESDAIILFHDLAAPDVGRGLDYFKQKGWHTMIYQTMQIMGVAWRGNVQPVIHQPDHNISWHLPAHLQGYVISGITSITSNSLIEQIEVYIDEINNNLITNIITEDNINKQELANLQRSAQKLYQQGNIDQALITFNQIININPKSPLANKYLSWLYWQKGNIQLSLRHQAVAEFSNREYINNQISREFLEILPKIRPYTLLSESRLYSLYCLAKQICLDDIPGNFVECGTWKGGTAAMLAFIIKKYSMRSRLLYAFDTFAGMPDPTEVDKHNGIPANHTGLGAGTLQAPILEGLKLACQALDVNDIVKPIPGLFADTLPQYKSEIGDIALLHADGDWYQSTMDIFNNLFSQVVENAVIQIDDYGFWEGCKKAIHEFEYSQNTTFPLRIIDDTGVWFRQEFTNINNYEINHWHHFWYLAQAAEKIGNIELAEKYARTVLKLVPGLVAAEEMILKGQKVDIKQQINLQEINLIIFPEWQNSEAEILIQLQKVFKAISNYHKNNQIALLIDSSNISEEDANLVVSAAVMNLLMAENLDINEEIQISVLGKLNQKEWQALLPLVNYRIILENENQGAIINAGAETISGCTIENLSY